jgi:PKD repeat protein
MFRRSLLPRCRRQVRRCGAAGCRSSLAIALTLVVSLSVGASGARAVVVDMGAIGKTNVQFNSSDRGSYTGVALVPGTRNGLASRGIPTVTSSAPCLDPALAPDLILPDTGLCAHGGAVMHSNETFDLAWDPVRRDWATTRNYVEQYLRDVSDGSGTLTSPYAVTPQYTDPSGRAGNASLYGGGCIDYGAAGGSTCKFGDATATGAGHDYLTNGCPVTGTNWFHEELSGVFGDVPNDICLTDAQIQGELAAMIAQEGLVGRTQPGYTPLFVVMTPPGVETCLDAAGKLCSANGGAPPPPPPPTLSTATSGGTIAPGTYQVKVTYVTAGGETSPSLSQTITTSGNTSTITIASPPSAGGATGWYAYVAPAEGTSFTRQQTGAPTPIGAKLTLTLPPTDTGAVPPLVPSFCSYHSRVNVGGTEVAYAVLPWTALTGCDEPGLEPFWDNNPAIQAGIRLVNPLSQAQIASSVNPGLDGWFALNGAEINDNGCIPFGTPADDVTVGSSAQNKYVLQREFNNAGVIETDPNALSCTPSVALAPAFVVPSPTNQGDVVQFDGSKTVSTLMVPRAGYIWNFGDGKTAVGPSVVHTYAKGGSYAVKLTVTDRGGNVRSLSQTIVVLGPDGKPVSPPVALTPGLQARLQLMPQGLRAMLHSGLAIQVRSNKAANGIVTLSVPREAARRAHIRTGRGTAVVIGRGSFSGIKAGTVTLHLRLSRTTAAKLRRLGHVTVTIRLALVAASGEHVAIDAAGRY